MTKAWRSVINFAVCGWVANGAFLAMFNGDLVWFLILAALSVLNGLIGYDLMVKFHRELEDEIASLQRHR